jgi:hypothetical protein
MPPRSETDLPPLSGRQTTAENNADTRQAMAGLPLPQSTPSPPTGPEFRTVLERQLAASLAAFDSQLEQERERLEQAQAERRAADFGPPDETLDGAVDQTDGAGPSYGYETRTAAAAGNVPESEPRRSNDTAAEPPDVAAGPTPEDIPDGQDDDIVARQIREAAEQETDPELREKLWEEYRKYKQSG